MSVWQTPQACRRTSASPARGPSSSRSWTTRGLPNSSSTAARICTAAILDPEDRNEALLGLGLDARDDLHVLLEARAAELGGEQLVDLEDPRRIRHRDLHPHGLVAPGGDLHVLDGIGGQRVDVLMP